MVQNGFMYGVSSIHMNYKVKIVAILTSVIAILTVIVSLLTNVPIP